jgi:glycosyltransferase involved in cell wall biosynthesis
MSLAIVIPAFNTQSSLDRVLSELPPETHSGVIVVDDGSITPITAPGFRVIRHPQNSGYGAAQKTGYDAALEGGATRIVLLHGDGQYATEDVLALTDVLAACDAAIGSRFLNHGGSQIPLWRRMGNRTLTMMANLRFGTQVSELHSGARGFKAETLRALDYHRFSDDYIFDHQVLATLLSQGASIGERRVRCAYDETVQSIAIGPSIRYALGVVGTILRPPEQG